MDRARRLGRAYGRDDGRLVNNAVVLEDGVRSGDRIVVDGMQKIGEGSKVVW